MSHLTSEVLWDAAKSPSQEQADHLAACAECQAKVAQVRSAQSSLIPTPVPPLPMTSARRIGKALEEAAEKELARKPLFSAPAWWPFSFSPTWAMAAVAAALLAVLAARVMAPSPVTPNEPVAHHEVPAPAPIAMPVPAPPVPAPVPAPAPVAKPQLAAAVMTARGATKGGGALDLKAELKAGDTVATAKGGELWLKLPDGSRAGLTPSSKVSIGSLTAEQLNLELDEGSVVVVARHLPERELKVTVGELEVRDVGTRFVVSRELNRAMVAVVEGVVEVKAPGETRQVKAGHIVRWQEGQLTEETFTPVAPKKTEKTPKTVEVGAKDSDTPAIPPQPQTQVEVEAPSTVPVAPVPTTPSPVAEAAKETPAGPKLDGSSEDEWAKPPSSAVKAPAAQGKEVPAKGGPSAPTGPGDAAVAAKELPMPWEKGGSQGPPADAGEEEDDSPPGPLDLLKMGIRGGVKLAKKLTNNNPRQREVREIGELTDGGNCEETLKRAADWLSADPSDSNEESTWKRQVLVNQMRCYRVLHRDTEADAIKRELQK